MADGFSLNVDPKFLQNLEEADKRIQKIAYTMEATSKRIIKSFQDINSQGLDVFVNKMNDVNKVISSLSDKKISISNILGGKSQTAKSVDDINKLIELLNKLSQETKKTQGANKRGGLFGDMSKSVSDWQALQKQISDNEKQISKLTQSTREYESTMKRIQSGKGGVIHGGASKEYQESIKNIETLRQQNASLQQKQQLIIQNNQALQAQANLQHQLKQYNQQQGSLPEQRKADELKRMNDYYRELEKSSKRASEESIKSSEKEAKARERAERASKKQAETEAKRQQRAAQSRETQILNAYNQAMKANEATVNQRINKLAKLRQVESQLAQDEAKYSSQLSRVRSEIDRLSQANDKAAKSTKQLQNNQRNLMDTSGQLQRKLALLFSVSAIQGYVSKLVEVRGEFEMQQRSLQVLLQNKDEANKLWDKTVALAVKSPFRVKDLVTYTKQLAAYRVEADKLYDTNRMLADVSAGLGVDMNRLILAYGQVKAANYLRGTELRQFSEAGVNMLGELAKYFTELEGRAVSVGDVFERVSKRMVSFEHVNEIFKRITSEGGIFFKMQEKQSETLKGMIMNFRDSMDLMLNEIGKEQDSILKNSIRLAKDFVDNWRQFAPLIQTIGVSFLAVFGVKQIAKIASAFGRLFSVLLANPIMLLASAAGVLTAALYSAHAATTKLQAAMNEVNKENTSSLEESIQLYRQLTDVINDSTKSYEEQDKAKSQLKNKFKDILPDQYLEVEYVQKLGDNYRDAEQAMFDYYNAKTREQKKARVEQTYEGDLEGKNIPELISSVKDWLGDMVEVGNITEDMRIRLTSGISGVINSLVEDVKNGKISADVQTFNDELKSRLAKYSGIDLSEIWGKTYTGVDERLASIQKVTTTLQKYASDLENIKGLSYETYDQEIAASMINQEKNNLNTAINSFKKAAELYRQYVNAVATGDETVSKKREKIEKDVQKILTDLPQELVAYSNYLKSAFAQMKKNADAGKFDFAKVLQSIESEMYATFDNKGNLSGGLAKIAFDRVTLNENANDAAKEMAENFKEGLSDKAKTLKMNDFQKAAIKGAEIIAEQFGISTDVFAKYVPKYGEAFSEVKTRIKSDVEYIETLLKAYDTSITTGAMEYSPALMTLSDEEIKAMRKNLPALKELLKYYGETEKGKKNRDNLIDERIKVVDQMNKKYQELNRTLGRTESLQGAFDAYKDAFASAYGRSDVKKMSAEEFVSKVLNFPNENDVVKWFDDLAKKTKNVEDKLKVELKKGEYVYDMKVRVEAESDKALLDQIEEMFSGYEMSIELDKLNIPPDLAKQLFNVDSLTLPELKSSIFDEFAKNAKISTSKLIEEFNKAEESGKFESLYAILGKDMTEKLKDSLKNIQDLEDKQQVERLKKYTKYLLKAQSERVKIKMDEIRQLKEIEDTFELKENVAKSKDLGMTNSQWDAYSKIAKSNEEINEEKLKSIGLTDEQIEKVLEYNKAMEKSKQLAIEGVQKETKEKTDKQTWEDFKGTEEYIRLFEDLNSASMSSLTSMKKRLDDMRTSLDDLPPEQLKEIVRLMEQLDEQRIKVNPFKTISEGISELKASREQLKNLKEDMSEKVGIDDFEILKERASQAKDAYELQQAIYKAKQEGKVIAGQEITIGKQTVKVTNDSLKDEEEKLTTLKKSNDALQKFLELYYKITGQQDKAENKIANTFGSFSEMFSNIAGSVDSLSQSFEKLGIGGQDLQDTMASISQGLNGVANIAQGAVGLMSGNPFEMISGGIQALSGLGEVIGSFFGNGDKKKERQIQREIKMVEDLERRYQKLEKAIDNAYALNTLQRSGQQAKSNINQQISAYERMIQAERDKKDTDDARIKEWQQAIEDLREQKAELDKKIVGTATGGILDDVLSAAQDFTNAWLDAFNETGDGLDGLSRNFKETMLEMVKQQAAMLISQAYIDKWKHQLSQYINPDDLELTTDEARRWIDSVTSSLPQLNEALERYFLAMKEAGVDLTGGNSELSGLQRGIQGITEQQADILAAYLNSIRFFVSDNNTYLSRIAESLGNTEIENPMVGQLRIIASQTTAINELLNSLTSGGHSMGGRGFRVFIS